MRERPPVPPEVLRGPIRASAARSAGMTAHDLRSGLLHTPFWGVRVVAAPTSMLDRFHAIAARMPPSAFFSHASAAIIHGMPLPARLERASDIHIAIAAPRRAPHAAGLRGHRLAIAEQDVTLVGGLAVTSVERTWCDLSTMLHLYDLVAAGDFLVHWRHPSTTTGRLFDALRRRWPGRGSRLLARAHGLLDDRSESPPESVVRIIAVEAGAPSVRANHVVTDSFGAFVARVDLYIEEWKLVIEYQGDYHRVEPGRWRADMTRRSRLESLGLGVMEVNADDLRDPIELAARIRRRGGRGA